MYVFSQRLSIIISVFFLTTSSVQAGDTTSYKFPGISVIGNKITSADIIPGTVNIVSKEIIQLSKGVNGTQALETVPGLNIVDEEGVGLRMNLSIRGLDPDRSRSVLVLEDGVPTALAPYGEPEMYYTPLMDRMSGVEIIKGSGSIGYGPQTIGGVVNFLTNEPGDLRGFTLKMGGGNGEYLNSKLSYGTTGSNYGILLEYNRKSAEQLGITGFNVDDVMLKFNLALSQKSTVKFKFGVYNELSNSTYVGLTQNMYEKGEYFTRIAPNDELAIRRYAAQLSHQYLVNENLFIVTNLYGYTIARNWRRQDFSYAKPTNWTGQVFGDTSIADGAIYMRNSTGNRNRQFEVFGIQPQVNYNFTTAGISNQLSAGVRFHYERAFEQTINGKTAAAVKGDLVADEIRTGLAGSAFIQNRLFITDEFVVTPGVRMEYFNYIREIARTNSKDTLITGESNVSELIPGIGVTLNLSEEFTLFGGVHKGFAPPRTKDAINNSGQAINLDAELSWNSEFGFRSTIDDLVNLEFAAYMLQFSNQIIPVSESSGGPGTDVGFVNAGSTFHRGVEFSANINLAKFIPSHYRIHLTSSANYNVSTYSSDRFIAITGQEKANIKGNELPYAPHLSFSGGLIVTTPFGTTLYVSGKYLGEQFSDELNSVAASANGRSGRIDGRTVLNVSVEHSFETTGISLFASVKNLFDERFISSRRPQGIKVGLPRIITGGVEVSL